VKQHSSAAERNVGPILAVLQQELPPAGAVLEVASGTGQHVVAFAAALRGLSWHPSDPQPEARASIAAYVAEAELPNVAAPLALDVIAAAAGAGPALPDPLAAIVCCNMIHISPWAATGALLELAAAQLAPGAPLVTYGPYLQTEPLRGPPPHPEGAQPRNTAASNAAFDASLRARDPAWGLRDLAAVDAAARAAGLRLARVVEMPANNLTLVWRR